MLGSSLQYWVTLCGLCSDLWLNIYLKNLVLYTTAINIGHRNRIRLKERLRTLAAFTSFCFPEDIDFCFDQRRDVDGQDALIALVLSLFPNLESISVSTPTMREHGTYHLTNQVVDRILKARSMKHGPQALTKLSKVTIGARGYHDYNKSLFWLRPLMTVPNLKTIDGFRKHVVSELLQPSQYELKSSEVTTIDMHDCLISAQTLDSMLARTNGLKNFHYTNDTYDSCQHRGHLQQPVLKPGDSNP